jgi:hypothetical protein
MTISTAQFTIGTAVKQIVQQATMPQRVTIHNNDSSQQVYIGNINVTTSNGLHLDGKEERQIMLNPGEGLFAVSDGDRSIGVMVQTQ